MISIGLMMIPALRPTKKWALKLAGQYLDPVGGDSHNYNSEKEK